MLREKLGSAALEEIMSVYWGSTGWENEKIDKQVTAGCGQEQDWRNGLKVKVRRNKKEVFQSCTGLKNKQMKRQWMRTCRFVSKVFLKCMCAKYVLKWFHSEWHHTLKICIGSEGGINVFWAPQLRAGNALCATSTASLRTLEAYEVVLTRYKCKGGSWNPVRIRCQSHTADKQWGQDSNQCLGHSLR